MKKIRVVNKPLIVSGEKTAVKKKSPLNFLWNFQIMCKINTNLISARLLESLTFLISESFKPIVNIAEKLFIKNK